MERVKINEKSPMVDIIVDYINFLEGIKTRCKAMHWTIMNVDVKAKRGAHIYLDEFLDKISNYEDMVAETSLGILGNFFTIYAIKGKEIPEGVADTPHTLCQWLLKNVGEFHKLLIDFDYIGIKSETETFIKDIQQYNYLFNLCRV